MTERQYLFTHDSAEVQGEGSFVKMRSLKVKEAKQLKKENAKLEERLSDARHELMLTERDYEAAQDNNDLVETASLNVRIKEINGEIEALTEEQEQQNLALLANHIVDWNWQDDDGNLLPLPKADASVLDELTIEEIQFLGELLNPGSERRKKLTSTFKHGSIPVGAKVRPKNTQT